VLVSDIKNPKINLTEKSISFQGEGSGAKGWNLYKFSLDFCNEINNDECVNKLSPTFVDVKLMKIGKGYWHRLIPQNVKKSHVFKLDFVRWQSESDAEEENLRREKEAAIAQLKKEVNDEDSMQKFYLTLCNDAQFILFFIILMACTVGRLMHGPDFFAETYEAIGSLVLITVALSYLEVIHPLLDLVKSPWQYCDVVSQYG